MKGPNAPRCLSVNATRADGGTSDDPGLDDGPWLRALVGQTFIQRV